MNQKVTLRKDGEQDEIIALETHMLNRAMVFEGVDPYNVPDRYKEGVRFFSKDLTMKVLYESDVEIVKVEPTGEEPDEVSSAW